MMSGNAVDTPICDPLRYTMPLPHCVRVFPYGFPAEIASNAPEVIEAAQESWSAYGFRFDQPPIRVHVLVSEGSSVRPPAPVLCGQRNLLMWVADRENFAGLDRLRRFGYSCVTRVTVADQVYFRWHFLDALIYMLLELNYLTSIHAACVAWRNVGVLLYGESGVGKSTLAYACARRGWTYISDDSSSILWGSGRTTLGEPHHFRFREDAPKLFPELRGLTVGYPLDRKPTIEVRTADLPILTAPESTVERIVFLDRRADGPIRLRGMEREDVRQRLTQDLPVFDAELEPRRRAVIEMMGELPAFELRYTRFADAARLLEEMMQDECRCAIPCDL